MITAVSDENEPENRPRVAFDVPPDLHKLVRVEAAKQNLAVAELARLALQRYIDKDSEDAKKYQAASKRKESDKTKRKRFLLAIAENFHSSKACRLTGIEKAQVKKWLTEPEFVSDFCDAQESYIEGVEATLLKLARGSVKGHMCAFLATQSFLNAHHPQHGRLKRELLSKIIGPMMLRFHKVVAEVATDDLAGRIVIKLREIAAEKLSEFSE